ncbi:MAG: DNA mismatch repair endonuclease MutL, partial [Clostridia bacterium]|nr:DNA mismatch repair endonuclease MutL [Clostridia bacterium]
MSKIRVLERDIANKIAAGEVVERPGSVVKELVENAMDAGAEHITVEIKNGGITYIRVTDDGCGMNREDARNCFLRHATSKIKDLSDLFAIETLGFRGEALAAISAVSRIELITSDGEKGTKLLLEGGEETQCEETGAPLGTTIIVKDLFFNTPARMKFLKTDRSEGGFIAALMDRLAISNPQISFKLIQDGKSTLSTDGGGKLLDVIYSVMGREVTKGMLQVDTSLQQVRVYGYTAVPTVTKNNRNYQLCYINGRLVRSQTVFAAIDQAYRNNLFHGRHAVCVIKLELPFGLVDVNVHPSKMEVKFSNEKLIFEAVYYALKTALNKQTMQ